MNELVLFTIVYLYSPHEPAVIVYGTTGSSESSKETQAIWISPQVPSTLACKVLGTYSHEPLYEEFLAGISLQVTSTLACKVLGTYIPVTRI